ncbi:MAG: ABC transporter substrate-binding protein [Flavobacteriales bacterium]
MKFPVFVYLPALFLLLFLGDGCGRQSGQAPQADLRSLPFDSVEAIARGSRVTLMMWQGDRNINRYMNTYVKPQLAERYGIELELASGQGREVVSALMAEAQAGASESDIDMAWINGETFYQLREIDALYGPFTDRLPNAQYVDWDNRFIAYDFQQPVEGYECPWGNVQFCLIYNSDRIATPPQTAEELAEWIKANPGRFTIGTDFTGMTFLKSLMINLADDPQAFDAPFTAERYAALSAPLWQWLTDVKPYLWREGQAFPNSVAPMHQLFSQGELWFTMSNNDGEVDNKVGTGDLPAFSRGYVLDGGSIQNSHYMGIVNRSGNKAGAMVVANFLLSPEAQLEKARSEVWGDGTVLDVTRLPDALRSEFESVTYRRNVAPRSELNTLTLPEPDAEYMIRLYTDFRTRIVEAQ